MSRRRFFILVAVFFGCWFGLAALTYAIERGPVWLEAAWTALLVLGVIVLVVRFYRKHVIR